jgi:hypothetical protein
MDMGAMRGPQAEQGAEQPPPQAAEKQEEEKPLDPVNVLRGILGR